MATFSATVETWAKSSYVAPCTSSNYPRTTRQEEQLQTPREDTHEKYRIVCFPILVINYWLQDAAKDQSAAWFIQDDKRVVYLFINCTYRPAIHLAVQNRIDCINAIIWCANSLVWVFACVSWAMTCRRKPWWNASEREKQAECVCVYPWRPGLGMSKPTVGSQPLEWWHDRGGVSSCCVCASEKEDEDSLGRSRYSIEKIRTQALFDWV